MYKYMLILYTEHDKTSQNLIISNDLIDIINIAKKARNHLYKDQTIIVKDNITNTTIYTVERW